ncbi:hypothetical protein LguiA_018154 [Lonicera macranthoides]
MAVANQSVASTNGTTRERELVECKKCNFWPMAASTSSRSNLSGRHTSSPKLAKPLKGITMPVISLSQPHDRVVEMISKPCREWGFFLVTDQGLQPELT